MIHDIVKIFPFYVNKKSNFYDIKQKCFLEKIFKTVQTTYSDLIG